MRIGVCHLKGVHRGRVETLAGPVVRIGTGPFCELRLEGAPGVEQQHASLEIEDYEVYLRPLGRVALNGAPCGEAVVQNYDLVEIGGNRLRLRLLPEGMELPARPGAPPRRPLVLPLLLLLMLVAGFAVARTLDSGPDLDRRIENESRWAGNRQRVNERRILVLSDEIADLKRRVANRTDVEQRMGEVQRAVAQVESSVLDRVTTEMRAAREATHAAERIIARRSPAVCLVQGAYGFGRVEHGKWRFLREAEPDLLDKLDIDGEKVPLMLEGNGPLFSVEFTGTGFLADASGVVLTNRHIAQPWWRNDAAQPLLEDGFEPRFMYLRVYFPKLDHAIECDVTRSVLSDEADIAAVRFDPAEKLPEPIPLAGSQALVVGRKVILLGYPSGLNALLARSDESFSRSITKAGEIDALRILDALAERGMIRPLPTRGHICDLVGGKLLFDAPTAVGGSGGPLLDMDGRVVAVNYGILKSFSGANFGVPVKHVAALLEKARRGSAAAARSR